MFRTLVVSVGERLTLEQNWLVVATDEKEDRIPITDIYVLVIDNLRITVSTPVLTALTQAGAHIIFCDDKHLPCSCMFSYNQHFEPLAVIRRQLAMSDDFKDALWKEIVKAKIINQARALRFCGCPEMSSDHLMKLSTQVIDGDETNREGLAAKFYFKTLFGSNFLRFADDDINAALNYGYTIIRSAVCRTLVSYGYNCVLGLHHINKNNAFNLADDLMEPFRPMADIWADMHHEELCCSLTKEQRLELINLPNLEVLLGKKYMKMRNALDAYVSSLTSALKKGDPSLLKIPLVLRPDSCHGE